MNILVYDGPGVANLQKPLMECLKKILRSHYDVLSVDHNGLRNSPWEETTKLLVMPGGRDLLFLSSLQNDGIQRIRRFVQRGGSYLGLCGGAYFACDRVEFEVGRSGYEVVGDRPLQLYNAVASGSVAPGFVYNSEEGALAMPIIGKDNFKLNVYVNGGPCFIQKPGGDDSAVMFRYQTNGQPAIIRSNFGEGKVVLSGPHIEVSAGYIRELISKLEQDGKTSEQLNHLQRIFPSLANSDQDRMKVFKEILLYLNLEIGEEVPANPKSTPMLIAARENSGLHIFEKKLLQFKTSESDSLVDIQDTVCRWKWPLHHPVVSQTFEDNSVMLAPHHLFNGECTFNISHFYEILRKAPSQGQCGSFLLYAEMVESTQTILEKYIKFDCKE
jgi:biotin--protein ligase